MLVDDLPLAAFTAVDMRYAERVARERPAVHRSSEAHKSGGPRHVRAHVERHDLVGNVVAAGQAGRLDCPGL